MRGLSEPNCAGPSELLEEHIPHYRQDRLGTVRPTVTTDSYNHSVFFSRLVMLASKV